MHDEACITLYMLCFVCCANVACDIVWVFNAARGIDGGVGGARKPRALGYSTTTCVC